VVEDKKNVRFEVLTVMTMKITILDVLPCIPVEIIYVSEECTASIFRVEDEVDQATGKSVLLTSSWLPPWIILRT
jgi:hypothetical protein